MIRLLPFVSTLVARSLRFTIEGTMPERAIVVFWHGKMFAGWFAAAKRKKGQGGIKPVALVSPSKDGSILTTVLHRWGYKVERGSSSKSGLEALSRAIARVRSGECNRIVITPDGPRGPLHRLKRGAFLAAHELDLPVYFLSIHYRSGRMLEKSWDKFEIPLPFSKIEIRIQQVDLTGYPEAIPDQHEWLNRTTREMNL